MYCCLAISRRYYPCSQSLSLVLTCFLCPILQWSLSFGVDGSVYMFPLGLNIMAPFVLCTLASWRFCVDHHLQQTCFSDEIWKMHCIYGYSNKLLSVDLIVCAFSKIIVCPPLGLLIAYLTMGSLSYNNTDFSFLECSLNSIKSGWLLSWCSGPYCTIGYIFQQTL